MTRAIALLRTAVMPSTSEDISEAV
jgi:hypothetical protein